MTDLHIESASDTPLISFSKQKGSFEIAGKSMPEDVSRFYDPVIDWMNEYKNDPLEKTVLDFKMIYFNTASSKMILDILMILEEIQEAGKEVLIRWHALKEDDDMVEAGEEYTDMVDLNFEFHTFKLN